MLSVLKVLTVALPFNTNRPEDCFTNSGRCCSLYFYMICIINTLLVPSAQFLSTQVGISCFKCILTKLVL